MVLLTHPARSALLLGLLATTVHAKTADQCAEEGACAPAEQEKEPETWTVQEDGSGSNPGPEQCQLYMAPSTLGVANMGMYTGVDLKDQEVVNFPEIVVPLLFREWGEHTPGFDDGGLWERYIWEGSVVDLESYDETDTEVSKAGFIPGIGCTINAVMDMNNIDSTHGSTYDTAGLHRSKDPGSGAFTPYHSSITNAAEEIPAGAELFAGYGSEWIPDIPGAQITLDKQLNKADDFLNDEYIPFVQEHKDEMSDEMKQALWEFASKDFPVYSQAMTNLPRHPWSEVEGVIQSKLQEDEEDVSITRAFIRKQHMRTMEWLRTHPNSYCQDHIRPDISTIPQAGRGAFANRDLAQGSVVGYAPLIHIGKDGRQVLHIQYDNVYQPGKRHTHDLVINYSFAHKNSTMILTPYGGMVNYINHASGDKANVKVRFPNKELVAHKPEWLNKDAEFFHNAFDKIGLSFEYIALRDIKEGEEVFMDYGPEWEAAWEEHVKNWKPLEGSEDYQHSTEIQAQEPFLRTQAEQAENPYPVTVQTMCLASYTTDEATGDYLFTPMLRDTTYRWYCDVIERHGNEEEGYVYDVDLRIDEGEQAAEADQEWVHVKNVAADSIFLMDRVFSNDWHLPGAFRHPIAVPDDVMPKAWENGPDTYVLPEDGPSTEEEEEYDEEEEYEGDGYYEDEEEMEMAEEY